MYGCKYDGKERKKEEEEEFIIYIYIFIGKKNVNFEETKCKRTREFPRSDGKREGGPISIGKRVPN